MLNMSTKDKSLISLTTSSTIEYEWTPEEEIQLFYALDGLRPVGINKHFYMACIAERLSKSLNRDVPGEVIWTHLASMYKLRELDALENLPFPNEEKEFFLPDQEYSALLQKKRDESDEKGSSSEISTSSNSINTDSFPKVVDKSNTSTKSPAVHQTKDLERKLATKLTELPKRPAKRTRGSMSFESNSPSTTPPPVHNNKRRRI